LSFTARIAHWSAVHRWIILLAAVLVIVLAVLAIRFVGTETRDDGGGVGESGEGSEILNERFASDRDASESASHTRRASVIFSNPSLNADSLAFKETVDSTMQVVRNLPQLLAALSYYDTREGRV